MDVLPRPTRVAADVEQRRRARRLAVQALYQMELAGASAEEAIDSALLVVESDDSAAGSGSEPPASGTPSAAAKGGIQQGVE